MPPPHVVCSLPLSSCRHSTIHRYLRHKARSLFTPDNDAEGTGRGSSTRSDIETGNGAINSAEETIALSWERRGLLVLIRARYENDQNEDSLDGRCPQKSASEIQYTHGMFSGSTRGSSTSTLLLGYDDVELFDCEISDNEDNSLRERSTIHPAALITSHEDSDFYYPRQDEESNRGRNGMMRKSWGLGRQSGCQHTRKQECSLCRSSSSSSTEYNSGGCGRPWGKSFAFFTSCGIFAGRRRDERRLRDVLTFAVSVEEHGIFRKIVGYL